MQASTHVLFLRTARTAHRSPICGPESPYGDSGIFDLESSEERYEEPVTPARPEYASSAGQDSDAGRIGGIGMQNAQNMTGAVSDDTDGTDQTNDADEAGLIDTTCRTIHFNEDTETDDFAELAD
ncbi:hypothetical protein CaCOL14_013149 [Colletotrichum acutatum]